LSTPVRLPHCEPGNPLNSSRALDRTAPALEPHLRPAPLLVPRSSVPPPASHRLPPRPQLAPRAAAGAAARRRTGPQTRPPASQAGHPHGPVPGRRMKGCSPAPPPGAKRPGTPPPAASQAQEAAGNTQHLSHDRDLLRLQTPGWRPLALGAPALQELRRPARPAQGARSRFLPRHRARSANRRRTRRAPRHLDRPCNARRLGRYQEVNTWTSSRSSSTSPSESGCSP